MLLEYFALQIVERLFRQQVRMPQCLLHKSAIQRNLMVVHQAQNMFLLDLFLNIFHVQYKNYQALLTSYLIRIVYLQQCNINKGILLLKETNLFLQNNCNTIYRVMQDFGHSTVFNPKRTLILLYTIMVQWSRNPHNTDV